MNAVKRPDDAELIAALVNRLGGGRLEPRELAGVLEAAGFRLELKATITRTTSPAKLALWRAEALAALEREPARAVRCDCTLSRPRAGSYSKHPGQCQATTIVAAVVVTGVGLNPDLLRYRFVCSRHVGAYPPADVAGIIHLTPRELEPLRQRERERQAAADRRYREEEAARELRALTIECPTCHAPPESRCGGRGGLHSVSHYDRVELANRDQADQHAAARGLGDLPTKDAN